MRNGSAVIATADGRTVYAVGRVGADLRIHRSTDGGVTWAPTGARTRIGASAAIEAAAGPDGTLEMAVFADQDGRQRYRSTDGGETVERSGPNRAPWRERCRAGYASRTDRPGCDLGAAGRRRVDEGDRAGTEVITAQT